MAADACLTLLFTQLSYRVASRRSSGEAKTDYETETHISPAADGQCGPEYLRVYHDSDPFWLPRTPAAMKHVGLS